MLTTREANGVVVLSESQSASRLAAQLAPRTRPVTWYASVDALVRAQPLSSVAVLIVQSATLPSGALLVTLGRMNIEYPAIQKVAVMDAAPPLPVAEYLTACGVNLVWEGSGEEKMEKLVAVVDRLRERRKWTACAPSPAPLQ